MSAIAGIYQYNNEPPLYDQGVALMDALGHYPADRIGVWSDKKVFFGCHTQWITPESMHEPLPYYDAERRLAITADAIIDNRDELMDQLQIERSQRRSIPDSELILLAYCKWGEAVSQYLLGDFVFMIWDARERKLYGARDFSGARTLYYCRGQSGFRFCTTIEPLFQLPGVKKSLNEDWIAQFLAIPGMAEAVDPLATVYEQIDQLPASHSIVITDDNVRISRYRPFQGEEQTKLRLKSDEAYIEAFRDVFQRAVVARLRTSGKVGAHLSGGLDSGTVASFAARELRSQNKVLHTYSYVPGDHFKDWTPKWYAANERPFIRQTVEFIGNVEDRYLDFPGRSSFVEIDDFLSIMEMPFKFFENSFWLKGIFETAHQDGIKLLLSGARGNHSISWGSWDLSMDYYAALLRRLKWLRLNRELTLYCQHFSTGKSVMLPTILKKAFPFIANQLVYRGTVGSSFPTIIHPEFAKRTNVFHKLHEYGVLLGGEMPTDLNEHRKNHYEHPFVWNKSGVATTKLSLRYGLWDRDPTNDIRVIRFCMSLPEEQFVQGGMERSFIRRATHNILPDSIRFNHQIRGFQGADTIPRMALHWAFFLDEVNKISENPILSEWIDISIIKEAVKKIGKEPRPEILLQAEFKVLTRCLILSRFLDKIK